jgi:hypothetical protein
MDNIIITLGPNCHFLVTSPYWIQLMIETRDRVLGFTPMCEN